MYLYMLFKVYISLWLPTIDLSIKCGCMYVLDTTFSRAVVAKRISK